ncbi:rna-directed rna polymerase [Cystoisospora suis]|uniref:Rna-directed rna polymerase n=1 Tax=Cystoisospora suis TaxID=483139 RepID=A0A2C6LCY2_9APIC|nr:rna-directed rna polymerase [Cystoisospora suis]
MANVEVLPSSRLPEKSGGVCDTPRSPGTLSVADRNRDVQSSRYSTSQRISVPRRILRRPRMNYLRRLRILEGENLLPSVEPFNKIILSFDFYRDIREEILAEDECPEKVGEPKGERGQIAKEENQTPQECRSTPGEPKRGTSSVSEGIAESADAGSADPASIRNDMSGSREAQENNSAEAGASATDSSETDSFDFSAEDSDNEFSASRLRSVPTYFRDAEDYVDTFFPLLIQEAKQCIHRAKRMEMSGPEKFVQIEESRDGEFISLSLGRPGGLSACPIHFYYSDLVVLYIPDQQLDSRRGPDDVPSSQKESPRFGDADATETFRSSELNTERTPGNGELEGKGPEGEQLENASESRADLIAKHKAHVLGVVHKMARGILGVKILMPGLSEPDGDSDEESDVAGAADIYQDVQSKSHLTRSCLTEASQEWDTLRKHRRRTRRAAHRERMRALMEALDGRQTCWHVCRVMGLTTLHREFQALMSIPDLIIRNQILCANKRCAGETNGPTKNPLLDDLSTAGEQASGDKLQDDGILLFPGSPVFIFWPRRGFSSMPNPAPSRSAAPGKPIPILSVVFFKSREASLSPADSRHLFIPDLLHKELHRRYNASQMQALNDCLKLQGITLIQGPPGTGKTTTIMAVLSVVLNAQMEENEVSAIAESSGPIKKTVGQASNKPVRDVGSLKRTERESEDREGSSGAERSADKVKEKLCLAHPWLSQGEYTPWMDDVTCMAEDLEALDALWSTSTSASSMERVFLEQGHNALLPNRVLVCAPSNAAIDEILKRLVTPPSKGGGIFDSQGRRYKPSVVRVGPNVHPDLARYSLEYQATRRMKFAGASRFSALAAIKAEILQEARIVCATLSVCGSRDITSSADLFDTVVVDEASQSVEISTLIPLRLGCRRLILVGDPRQLPATIFSRVAIQHRYSQSLFQRLEAAGHKVNMLSVQYRMHPSISKFASSTFYQNQLRDAENIADLVQPPVPWYNIPIFKPLVFFAVNSTHMDSGTSLVNVDEANIVCQLIYLLKSVFTALGQAEWGGRVAVISPYAQQVKLIRQQIKAKLGVTDGSMCPIDVNTVDGFQGQEKDLVIFSAVRAEYAGPTTESTNLASSVGFLADERRINVALTRGRANLWIVGNGRFLMTNYHWRCLWKYTKEMGTLISIDEKFMKTELLLAKWLVKYANKNPAEQRMLDQHVPGFLASLQKDIKEASRRCRNLPVSDESLSLEAVDQEPPPARAGVAP